VLATYSNLLNFGTFHEEISSEKITDIVVFFLLRDSSASEIYVPTFRNTLSVPSS